METSVTPRLRRRRGRPPTPGLREVILRAAAAVFTRRDYHEAQMDEVVEASGVGKGTLYRYFPSKRDLYLAVMFDGIEALRAELEDVVRTDDAPARKVERIVHRTLTYFWNQHLFFSLIHRNEHKADGEARQWFRHRAKLSALIQETLREAMGAGQLRPVDARIATEMLLGMMRGVNRYRSAADRLDDLVGAVVDVFMNGIGTTAGRRIVAPGSDEGRRRAGGRRETKGPGRPRLQASGGK
jgi:AcrR family transcriptional regulator